MGECSDCRHSEVEMHEAPCRACKKDDYSGWTSKQRPMSAASVGTNVNDGQVIVITRDKFSTIDGVDVGSPTPHLVLKRRPGEDDDGYEARADARVGELERAVDGCETDPDGYQYRWDYAATEE